MDISFVEIEQLIKELQNRTDSSVICLLKQENDGSIKHLMVPHGNISTCIGLCRQMENKLLQG